MARAYVGLSGYSYKPWQGEGRFYPVGLKQKEFLGYYCERYNAVEMDGSWYKTPTEEAVKLWIEGSPEATQFSFKLHRRITHLGRLKEETYPDVHYFLRRMLPMARAGRLGPFLIQLPPNLKRDDERLEGFLAELPDDFSCVKELECEEGLRPRWSVEFRHASWVCDEVDELMRKYNVAWVASDRDEAKADRNDTADFHYIRLRRLDTTEETLTEWSQYIQAQVDKGKDCYVYCKHEDDGSPWEWADFLLDKLT
ncbi:MAG TPA: DUF72 domain-containing protein [Fimbriimonas sp.]|nr:DUF72 domain-containing protein [Fimbriimonas sp.]